MTDGPFAETKEVVGGYALVDVESADKARRSRSSSWNCTGVHWPELKLRGKCDRWRTCRMVTP
jgi:hypothetical protein